MGVVRLECVGLGVTVVVARISSDGSTKENQVARNRDLVLIRVFKRYFSLQS